MKSNSDFPSIKKIVILASGGGSNAENIIRFFADIPGIEVVSVLTNNPKAGVIDRCKRLKAPYSVLSKETCLDGALLNSVLDEFRPNLIVLAGYLLKIPSEVIQHYPIVNIHPALLPKYGGKGMYGRHVHEAVVASKDKESGITIHYVNSQYDKGQIIFQATCPIEPTDTSLEVAEKIHHLEMIHFPNIIAQILHD